MNKCSAKPILHVVSKAPFRGSQKTLTSTKYGELTFFDFPQKDFVGTQYSIFVQFSRSRCVGIFVFGSSGRKVKKNILKRTCIQKYNYVFAQTHTHTHNYTPLHTYLRHNEGTILVELQMFFVRQNQMEGD